MPRRVRVSNHGEVQPGEWIPAHAVRFRDSGEVDVMTEGGGPVPNGARPGFELSRKPSGRYEGRIGRADGHRAFTGGKTLEEALEKAQAYADKYHEDVVVVDAIHGAGFKDYIEVGRAYGWQPGPFYQGPPVTRPYANPSELERLEERISAQVDRINRIGPTDANIRKLRELKDRRDVLMGEEPQRLTGKPGYLLPHEEAAIAARKGSYRTTLYNPKPVTLREVTEAAASYQAMVHAYGENNMATERASWRYHDLQRQWDAQKAARKAKVS